MNQTLLQIVREFREHNDGVRFGQWLCNVLHANGIALEPGLFYIEDDVLAKMMEDAE